MCYFDAYSSEYLPQSFYNFLINLANRQSDEQTQIRRDNRTFFIWEGKSIIYW